MFRIAVNGKDYHRLFRIHFVMILQIGSRKGDRREGVSPARLFGHAYIKPELASHFFRLHPSGSDRDLLVRVDHANLTDHHFQHGLIAAVSVIEQLNELLGMHIIADGPEAFSAAAAKENHPHMLCPLLLPTL